MNVQRYIARGLQESGQEALRYSVVGIVRKVMELGWNNILSRNKVEGLDERLVRQTDRNSDRYSR